MTTDVDLCALGILLVISILSWVAWGLLQNQRIIWDRPRCIALALGVFTTCVAWGEFLLMRGTP